MSYKVKNKYEWWYFNSNALWGKIVGNALGY